MGLCNLCFAFVDEIERLEDIRVVKESRKDCCLLLFDFLSYVLNWVLGFLLKDVCNLYVLMKF